MKDKLLNFWDKTDKYTSVPILTSILSSLPVIILFFAIYNKLPNKLPLFYSLPWGESQLVAKQQFLLLPTVLLLITLVNTFISSQIHPVQLVLKRMLMLTLLLINLIILITALKILFIFF
ncbi:MAG: hypothetical protein V1808_05130 [Candidatus Daviesbacteria bacterium]